MSLLAAIALIIACAAASYVGAIAGLLFVAHWAETHPDAAK